jgi:superoxide dismutase, Cu-Zn family
MKRPSVAVAALLVAATSSLAYGLALRHGGWSGMVMGLGESKVHGTVTMKAGKDANTTEVVLKYTGDTPGTARPWHVHTGSCAKGGGILGGGKSYTTAASDDKGAVELKAILPIALPDTGSYNVNVHESMANMGKYVACGDLKADK